MWTLQRLATAARPEKSLFKTITIDFMRFSTNSGLKEPDDRGNQPDTWECHLRGWLLNGLRPEIAQAVKYSYIEWKNGWLSAILAHALYTEEQQMVKKLTGLTENYSMP